MKIFFAEMKRVLLKKDLPPKIISLILAVMVWTYINSAQTGSKTLSVPIDIINLPQHLTISYIPGRFVKITFTGNREDLKNISSKNLKAVVNLQNPVVGERIKYPIEIVKFQVPETIRYTIQSGTISIKVEQKLVKKLKIIPEISGKVKNGYIRGTIIIKPEFVTVYGPESIMNELHTVKTKTIAIDNASFRVRRIIAIHRAAYKGLEFEPTHATVIIPIFESSNIQTIQKKVEIRYQTGEVAHTLLNGQNIKLYIKQADKNSKLSDTDIEAYLDFSSIDRKIFYGTEKTIIREIPVKIKIKTGNENFKFIRSEPETIRVQFDAIIK